MGDCIKQARSFMRDCEDILATLDIDCVSSRTQALTSIQSHAKRNHARAIYRAAQDAIDSADYKAAIIARLTALETLVRHYDSGLTEMETHANDSSHISASKQETMRPILSPVELLGRAQTTLRGTVSFAKPEERHSLERLLTLAHPERAALNQNTTLEVTASQNTQTDTNFPSHASLSLDAIIPEVVQQGLAAARQAGLTLSVSYDMGDIALSAPKTQIMKNRLKDWVYTLVLHMKTSVNEDNFARIDMTARQDAVILSADCPALSEDILNTAPDGSRVIQTYHEATGLLELALYYRHKKDVVLAHQTLKKLPVEQGIASRLSALLEGAEDKTISLLDKPAFIDAISDTDTARTDKTSDASPSAVEQQRRTAS